MDCDSCTTFYDEFDTSYTSCDFCTDGYVLYYDIDDIYCIPIEDCTNGMYADDYGYCNYCWEDNCSECPNDICSLCMDGFEFNAAGVCALTATCDDPDTPFYSLVDPVGCIDACPEGSVEQVDVGITLCVECDPTCSTCVYGSPDGCSTCPDGVFLENLNYSGSGNAFGWCIEDCSYWGLAYYEHTNEDGTMLDACAWCEDVIPNCEYCYVEDDLTNVCDQCYDGFYLSDDGECISECPPGEYQKDGVCYGCQIDDCLQCYWDSFMMQEACEACTSGLYLKGNICTDDCGIGMLPQIQDPQVVTDVVTEICTPCQDGDDGCSACDDNCLTCLGDAMFCTSCPFYLVWDNFECLGECSDPAAIAIPFFDGTMGCLSPPENCLEFSEYGCYLCDDGYIVKEGFCVPSDGQDVNADCGDGFYYDYEWEACFRCNPLCETCVDFNICISCDESVYQLYNEFCYCKEEFVAEFTDDLQSIIFRAEQSSTQFTALYLSGNSDLQYFNSLESWQWVAEPYIQSMYIWYGFTEKMYIKIQEGDFDVNAFYDEIQAQEVHEDLTVAAYAEQFTDRISMYDQFKDTDTPEDFAYEMIGDSMWWPGYFDLTVENDVNLGEHLKLNYGQLDTFITEFHLIDGYIKPKNCHGPVKNIYSLDVDGSSITPSFSLTTGYTNNIIPQCADIYVEVENLDGTPSIPQYDWALVHVQELPVQDPPVYVSDTDSIVVNLVDYIDYYNQWAEGELWIDGYEFQDLLGYQITVSLTVTNYFGNSDTQEIDISIDSDGTSGIIIYESNAQYTISRDSYTWHSVYYDVASCDIDWNDFYYYCTIPNDSTQYDWCEFPSYTFNAFETTTVTACVEDTTGTFDTVCDDTITVYADGFEIEAYVVPGSVPNILLNDNLFYLDFLVDQSQIDSVVLTVEVTPDYVQWEISQDNLQFGEFLYRELTILSTDDIQDGDEIIINFTISDGVNTVMAEPQIIYAFSTDIPGVINISQQEAYVQTYRNTKFSFLSYDPSIDLSQATFTFSLFKGNTPVTLTQNQYQQPSQGNNFFILPNVLHKQTATDQFKYTLKLKIELNGDTTNKQVIFETQSNDMTCSLANDPSSGNTNTAFTFDVGVANPSNRKVKLSLYNPSSQNFVLFTSGVVPSYTFNIFPMYVDATSGQAQIQLECFTPNLKYYKKVTKNITVDTNVTVDLSTTQVTSQNAAALANSGADLTPDQAAQVQTYLSSNSQGNAIENAATLASFEQQTTGTITQTDIIQTAVQENTQVQVQESGSVVATPPALDTVVSLVNIIEKLYMLGTLDSAEEALVDEMLFICFTYLEQNAQEGQVTSLQGSGFVTAVYQPSADELASGYQCQPDNNSSVDVPPGLNGNVQASISDVQKDDTQVSTTFSYAQTQSQGHMNGDIEITTLEDHDPVQITLGLDQRRLRRLSSSTFQCKQEQSGSTVDIPTVVNSDGTVGCQVTSPGKVYIISVPAESPSEEPAAEQPPIEKTPEEVNARLTSGFIIYALIAINALFIIGLIIARKMMKLSKVQQFKTESVPEMTMKQGGAGHMKLKKIQSSSDDIPKKKKISDESLPPIEHTKNRPPVDIEQQWNFAQGVDASIEEIKSNGLDQVDNECQDDVNVLQMNDLSQIARLQSTDRGMNQTGRMQSTGRQFLGETSNRNLDDSTAGLNLNAIREDLRSQGKLDGEFPDNRLANHGKQGSQEVMVLNEMGSSQGFTQTKLSFKETFLQGHTYLNPFNSDCYEINRDLRMWKAAFSLVTIALIPGVAFLLFGKMDGVSLAVSILGELILMRLAQMLYDDVLIFIEKKKKEKGLIILLAFLYIAMNGACILLALGQNQDQFDGWTISFLICLGVEILVCESIKAIIQYCILKGLKKEYDSGNKNPKTVGAILAKKSLRKAFGIL